MKDEVDDDWSGRPFERNRYFTDKRLTAHDCEAEQHYHERKRRLLNRMIHGCGVVCGLGVDPGACAPREGRLQLTIRQGFALDGRGRELALFHDHDVALEIPREKDDDPTSAFAHDLVLCLTYCAKAVGPIDRPGDASCDIESPTYGRVRDDWTLTLLPARQWKEPTCEHPCPLTDMRDPEQARAGEDGSSLESLHDYLVRKRTKACPKCCGDCVVLARLRVRTPDPQTKEGRDRTVPTTDPQRSYEIDVSARALVYTNPLLFDLVRCHHGDLPRITKISWTNIHENGPAPDVTKRRPEAVSWQTARDVLEQGLTVTFDQEMRCDTVNVHSFQVRVMTHDRGDGYRDFRLLPGRPTPKNSKTHEGSDVCWDTEFTFHCDQKWLARELAKTFDDEEGEPSTLYNGYRLEILLRGALIRSRKGRRLDGDPIAFPTGNGTEGGDFISYCRVSRYAAPVADPNAGSPISSPNTSTQTTPNR